MSGRLHGLDLIRLVSFFAIATFHVSLIHYHSQDIAIAGESLVIRAVEQTARVLAFSGFTICFLSSLLTAFSGSSLPKRIRLFSFLIVGWAAFSALMVAPEETWFVWDIYPLIFTGVLLCSIIQLYSEKVLRYFGILGFVMLCIPFWKFNPYVNLPDPLKSVLGFGACTDDVVEWPILPWLGLVSFGYWAGNEVRHRWQARENGFFRIEKKEAAVWAVMLGASTLHFGDFYGIRLGQAFSCEAYQQPPVVWWSHFIWPLFLMRLSFEPRVQARLAAWSPVRWISSLAISRKFWLAYFSNYLLCYALSALVTTSGVEATAWNVPVIAFIAVFLVPMTELLTRLILFVASAFRPIWKRASLFPRDADAPANSQSGASLVAVMLTVAAMGAMVGGVTYMVHNRVQERILHSTIAGRQFAFDQLREAALSPEAVKASAVTDPLLASCINGGNCKGGPKAAWDDIRPLTLRVPMEYGKPPEIMAKPGTGQASTHYNWRGLRGCTNAKDGDTCMFTAQAQWWAECKNKQPNCSGTNVYRIFVLPRIVPLATGKSNQRGAANSAEINSFPSDKQVKEEKDRARDGRPLQFSTSVLMTDIRGDKVSQDCPDGMMVTGTFENGSVKCDCEHGYKARLDGQGKKVEDKATGYPICDVAACKAPQIMIGVDGEGNVKCALPQEKDYICRNTSSVGSSGTVKCNANERIRKLQISNDCLIKNEKVDCGDMKFTCCRLK